MIDLLREDYHADGQSWREPVEVESTNDPGDRSAVLKTEPTTGQDWLPYQLMSGDVSHFAVAIVVNRATDFLASVHDEWAIAGDWLVEWLAG